MGKQEKSARRDRSREDAKLPVVALDKLPEWVRPIVLAHTLGISTKILKRREGVDGFPFAIRGPGRRALYPRKAVKNCLRRQESGPK